MDIETARANMIEQQIRPWNVLEMQTLNALRQIRREDFVPDECRHLAFADVQIPLTPSSDDGGGGEVMLEPKVGARMLEALALGADDTVLEIGAGSGYLVALLAAVSAHVTAVEINEQLLARARRNLAMAAIDNVTLELGDAHAGWSSTKQFDAILISGSLPKITDAWADALAVGGRLTGIEGHLPAMTVVRLTKTDTGNGIVRETLFETVAPRLRNVVEKPEFQF